MKRVLVFGMTENPGGVEKVIIEYYRNIDRKKIQFDFLCNSYNKVAYEDELIALGGRTFHITARRSNPSLYKKELNEVFEKHSSEWMAIWVNVCSLANIDYLKYAKKYNIEKRIIHSHNSHNMDSKLRGLLHTYNKKRVDKYATDFWACSRNAAEWFYNDKILDKVVYINNAVDTELMRFDENKCAALRNEYGFDDKYVIGNVGRLHFQKNQKFILDIFKEYNDRHKESVLVLVGQGEDEEALKEKTKELKIEDKVLFAGMQKDIQAWLSAFDLFLFPSLFEGLSVAALEAQVNGVPVLASKGVIPEEVKMNDNFIFFDLQNDALKWCEAIERMKDYKRPSHEMIENNFTAKGFNIKNEAKKLVNLLLD